MDRAGDPTFGANPPGKLKPGFVFATDTKNETRLRISQADEESHLEPVS